MGILDLVGRRVGVNGATIIRGDMGGEFGGVVVEEEEDDDDIMGVVDGQEADKGLQESLRRQLGQSAMFQVPCSNVPEGGLYRPTFRYNIRGNYQGRLSASHTWRCRMVSSNRPIDPCETQGL